MKKVLSVFGILIAVMMLSGWHWLQSEMGTEVVEETYTVQRGDTLRGISERYLALNTGDRRYILDFEYDIRQANPELQKSVMLQPGQKITIKYRIKK